jgi:hypothetical protein
MLLTWVNSPPTRQEKQRWKHNHFDAYKANTAETATRSLPPGTNGTGPAALMLRSINTDQKRVAKLCGRQCVRLWVEAAAVCGLTHECPFTPGRHLTCHTPGDISMAWRQNVGAVNCKRIAFIFFYYGTEVHKMALSTPHRDATAYHIMDTLGIEMDVLPAAMRGGQKTCLQQQYSNTANNKKHNILRSGKEKHQVQVTCEEGQSQAQARTTKNWRRPKSMFFIKRQNPSDSTKLLVDKVRLQ